MVLKHSPIVRSVVLLMAVLVLGGACAPARKGKMPSAGTTEADKYLFERGTESLNKKRWLKAREYFRTIVDNYPQSRFRPDAKLGLGDSYLGENSSEALVLSINEFREFLTFYPTHERAHYAQYKLALAHYAQMLTPQRDQSQTKDAVKEFATFVERYPKSTLYKDGQQKLRESRDRLSDADYQVGYFYYRVKWYPGAIARFRTVMKDDPTYTNRDALYYYLADCYVKLLAPAEAIPLLDKLEKEFEKSEYLERAKKLMVLAQNPPAAPLPKAKKGKGAE
jgi:outer membrane protein assembly factor BamD